MPNAEFTVLDWTVVVLYFVVTLALGFAVSRRGGRSFQDYFVSGRSLPWWLAGTSMVATTFAADTPLAVTGIVAKNGIAGNWIWWSFLPGALLTVFFFAGLWRRAEVVTDAEFIALRYDGAPARFLRGFRAVYLGVLANGIIMGWVNLAMIKILGALLDVQVEYAMGLCLAGTLLYTTAAGLWGIVTTDLFQFLLGMGGTTALAFYAVGEVGGLDAMMEGLRTATPPGSDVPHGDGMLSFLPDADQAWGLPIITFAVYLTLNWWASWYPGAEPGGGGYIAQRIFATKNERHAVLAALWFNIAHYGIRPWPWIITGLCGLALYGNTLLNPDGDPDPELNYLAVMIRSLPPGMLGLLVAAFVAAYMSTISTQINWGASYLVNDLWLPFFSRSKDPQAALWVGRVMTVVVFALSLLITRYMSSIEGAWKILLALGAGTGLVLILRWYWWRVNAWSEISAMGAALAVGGSLSLGTNGQRFTHHLGFADAAEFAITLTTTLLATTVVWLVATFATSPEPRDKLESFVARVRPPGPGWKAVTGEASPLHLAPRSAAWAGSLALVYGALFGTGHLLLGRSGEAGLCLGAAAVGGVVVARALAHPCFRAAPDGTATP